MQTVYEKTDGAFTIKLEKYAGKELFRVTYGLQVETSLTYTNAALQLGAAIMHCAGCDGLLDEREVAA